MANNKRPRKAYKPRNVSVPMMAETRDSLAMELHAAIETLIHAPSITAYNNVSTKMVTLGRAAGMSDCLEDAKAALIGISDRFERMKKVGVSPHEAQQLRESSAGLDALLASIPINRLRHAEMVTAMHCVELGVE
jgi:hypothetical protein